MKMKLVALFLCLFLSACAAQNSAVPLPSQVMQVEAGESILIRLNQGQVTLRGGDAAQVVVDGQTLFPNKTEFNVTTVNDQIQVIARYTGNRSSNPPINLEVSIPHKVPLKIETETASIVIHDYDGELEVESVSGNIRIENVNGRIIVRSNRGNVNVENSVGNISVVGNYGLLTLESASGDIGVSTIMGTIKFNGLIAANDNVRLETDHGPVSVSLSPDSTLNLQVDSTSGDVACSLPDISASLRTCDGVLNSGGGALTIRTVSGAVTLQSLP